MLIPLTALVGGKTLFRLRRILASTTPLVIVNPQVTNHIDLEYSAGTLKIVSDLRFDLYH